MTDAFYLGEPEADGYTQVGFAIFKSIQYTPSLIIFDLLECSV